MIALGNIGGVMISTLAWNTRGVRFESCSKCNISHFHHHSPRHWCRNQDAVQDMRCVVVESTLCVYIYVSAITHMHVIVSIRHL